MSLSTPLRSWNLPASVVPWASSHTQATQVLGACLTRIHTWPDRNCRHGEDPHCSRRRTRSCTRWRCVEMRESVYQVPVEGRQKYWVSVRVANNLVNASEKANERMNGDIVTWGAKMDAFGCNYLISTPSCLGNWNLWLAFVMPSLWWFHQ